MKQFLILISAVLVCFITACGQTAAGRFVGVYDVYGYIKIGGGIEVRKIGSGTFNKDGSCIVHIKGSISQKGQYTFKRISGNSVDPESDTPYIYELSTSSNDSEEVLTLKEINENFVPKLKKQLLNTTGYITNDPLPDTDNAYIIFIKQ